MTPAETTQLIELVTFIVGYFAIGGIPSLIAGRIIHRSNNIDQN